MSQLLARIAGLVVMLMISLTGHAARVDGLFQAQVAVAGRDTRSRELALTVALDEVLTRLTGNAVAVQSSAQRDLRNAPGRFVEQYRYVEPTDAESGPLQLRVQFDGVTLERELRQAGVPYWGQERPDVLAWLAVDDRGQRFLIAESSADAAQFALQAAQRHGLPLTLPLYDLEDQRAVQFTDVWGGFTDTVLTASERYRPQLVFTGRLSGGISGDWRGEWQLLNAGARQDWVTHAATLQALLDTGLAEAGAWLAQRYAVVAAAAGVRSLIVEEVRSLGDYARVAAYLGRLSLVDSVNVARVTDQEVEFDLRMSADEDSLWQQISLGRLLEPVTGVDRWRFRLQP
jgi:hypothetical protein